MNSHSRIVLAGALMFAALVPAAAQTRNTWSAQGSALYTGLGGHAYSGLDPGAGIEIQGRRKIDPLLSLGCGVQGTFHNRSNPSGSESLQGLFCEPRRLVDINSETIFPYLSARAALLRQELTAGSTTGSAKGIALNVGAGIMHPIGNTAGQYPTLLEFGASGGYTQFGDFVYSRGGYTTEKTGSGGGWNFVVRVGIAVGLPFNNPTK